MKRFLLVLALALVAPLVLNALDGPDHSIYLNDVFEIPLMATPSTGYGWYLTDFDKEYIQAIGQSFFRRVPGERGIGTIEQQVFKFKTLKEGTTKISFEEKREGGEPRQTITIVIEITKPPGHLILDHPWTKSVVLIGSLGFGGMGTGFIVSENGYIVTANHVIDEFGMVVILPEPFSYRTSRVIYRDELHDIALIKVEVEGLTPLPIGRLSDNQIGDPLFVLGHPYGIGWVFTRGIFSAIKYDRDGYAYLLSDVTTEQGNSGSPILNARGEIIGMVQQGVSGLAVGISADKFVLIITAAIQADQELAKIRESLNRLNERSRLEWQKIMESKD